MRYTRLATLCLIISTVLTISLFPIAQADSLDTENIDKLHASAVTLARTGQISDSLNLLRQLYTEYPNYRPGLFDYLTVLNWAGENASAILIYEKSGLTEAPNYVLNSIGGAYYRLGNYQKAQALFHKASDGDDLQAIRWEAECFMRMNNFSEGIALYDKLLLLNPIDIETYLSRASMLTLAKEYPAALADYTKALSLLSPSDTSAVERRKIHAAMAEAFINDGRPLEAAVVLKEYITDNTADAYMQGNYILAMHNLRQCQLAINQAQNMWPSHDTIPLFALKALADCYAKTGEINKAIALYRNILVRDPKYQETQASLGYALILRGDTAEGMTAYHKAIVGNQKLAATVANDASTLMTKGRFVSGKELYILLIDTFPTNPIYQRMLADDLLNNGLPRQAYKEYENLNTNNYFAPAGLVGMAKSLAAVGDFSASNRLITRLHQRFELIPAEQNELSASSPDTLGDTKLSYNHFISSDSTYTEEMILSSEQYLDGSFTAKMQTEHISLYDNTANPPITLNKHSVGTSYTGLHFNTQIELNHYDGIKSFNGYSLSSTYYFDDQLSVGFSTEKAPILDTDVLTAVGSPLMADHHSVSLLRSIGRNESYSATVFHSYYRDGNKRNGYNVSYTRTLFSDSSNVVNLSGYWGKSFWNEQQHTYDSPVERKAYGVTLANRHSLNNGYLQTALTFDWGADRPAPVSFTPALQFEYKHTLSPGHSFDVSGGYGLNTVWSDGLKGLGYSYKYYNISYQADL